MCLGFSETPLRRSPDAKRQNSTQQLAPISSKFKLIAVQETGVSQHHGGPIEGPPETLRTSQHYHIEGIKGVPDLGTKGNENIVFSLRNIQK